MNFLIVGNGFDLAHKLPTSYTDFLFFLKHKDSVLSYIEKRSGQRNLKDTLTIHSALIRMRSYPNVRITY
ncbi:AbiH family protein [Butyrivibrio sp. NC2007]|uniref:AbiH family protein n=1 Tax=Butyrivibrio sp. NC2007 TaxID=1280683 RepID=UPI0009DC1805